MNELIIVVIALVISVISSIIKAGKKAKENQHNAPGNNPWEDIVKEEEVVRPIRSFTNTHDSALSAESLEIHNVQQNRIATIVQRYENKSTVSAMPDEDNEAKSAQEEQPSQVMQNFNVIDAVIYSEILKPKF